VLLGDAFGFVDPMLSPGLFMSLEGARQLAEGVFANGAEILMQPVALKRALIRYDRQIIEWHHAWQELVKYFYDGQIFRIHLAGKHLAMKPSPFNLASRMERHTTAHIASMASGGWTRSAYSRTLIRLLSRYLVWDVPPAESFAVRQMSRDEPRSQADSSITA
jgi:flavin-dependent dehydrogenase